MVVKMFLASLGLMWATIALTPRLFPSFQYLPLGHEQVNFWERRKMKNIVIFGMTCLGKLMLTWNYKILFPPWYFYLNLLCSAVFSTLGQHTPVNDRRTDGYPLIAFVVMLYDHGNASLKSTSSLGKSADSLLFVVINLAVAPNEAHFIVPVSATTWASEGFLPGRPNCRFFQRLATRVFKKGSKSGEISFYQTRNKKSNFLLKM